MQQGKNNCCPHCGANEEKYLTGKCCEGNQQDCYEAAMDEERNER